MRSVTRCLPKRSERVIVTVAPSLRWVGAAGRRALTAAHPAPHRGAALLALLGGEPKGRLVARDRTIAPARGIRAKLDVGPRDQAVLDACIESGKRGVAVKAANRFAPMDLFNDHRVLQC